jgi:post-segregation antitoxin (ccd killing protein)
MGATETVTAKVPRNTKETLSRYGVNVSALIRETLEKEAKRLEDEETNKIVEEVAELLKDIPRENFIEDIRRDRDSR